MAHPNYPEVGAVWPSKDAKIEGMAYIKLPNGMYLNLMPTKNKVEGDGKPLYQVSMKKADFEQLFPDAMSPESVGALMGQAKSGDVPF